MDRTVTRAIEVGGTVLDGLEIVGVLMGVLVVLALAVAIALGVRHLARRPEKRRRARAESMRSLGSRREQQIVVRESEARDAQLTAEAARAEAARLERAAEHLHASAAEMRAEQLADLEKADRLDPDVPPGQASAPEPGAPTDGDPASG